MSKTLRWLLTIAVYLLFWGAIMGALTMIAGLISVSLMGGFWQLLWAVAAALIAVPLGRIAYYRLR